MSTSLTVSPSAATRISRAQWLALFAALLGWLFDGAEMGVFSMVGRPAIIDLFDYTETPLSPEHDESVRLWLSVVFAGFLVGAAAGGVLFGWLGDRIGRVRAMALSVLTYALFTGLCGFAGGVGQLLALRFIASLGMGGEWSLGVALVMEVWPNRSRAFMAGLIGVAANFGYMLVGIVGLALAGLLGGMEVWLASAGLSQDTVTRLVSHDGWRIMMLFGTVPALLTFFIRLFVPESKRWEEERSKGATSSWATRDLLGVLLGTLGPAFIIFIWVWNGIWKGTEVVAGAKLMALRLSATVIGLIVATVGYTYPVVCYLRRQELGHEALSPWRHPTIRRMLLGACLSGVALLGTWGSAQWAPSWANQLTDRERLEGVQRNAKEYTQIALAIGAMAGTLLSALMGDWLGRRKTYCIFCVLSLLSIVLLFQTNQAFGSWFLVCAGLAGGCTASFYGWLPLYLPELFPTSVRATGQGFSFNFGRILAAVGAVNVGTLFAFGDLTIGSMTFVGGYPLTCTAVSVIYLAGVVIIWLAPETRGQPLPE
jgi:MFS family permease